MFTKLTIEWWPPSGWGLIQTTALRGRPSAANGYGKPKKGSGKLAPAAEKRETPTTCGGYPPHLPAISEARHLRLHSSIPVNMSTSARNYAAAKLPRRRSGSAWRSPPGSTASMWRPHPVDMTAAGLRRTI